MSGAAAVCLLATVALVLAVVLGLTLVLHWYCTGTGLVLPLGYVSVRLYRSASDSLCHARRMSRTACTKQMVIETGKPIARHPVLGGDQPSQMVSAAASSGAAARSRLYAATRCRRGYRAATS
jgi:hypothetical protein